MNQAKLRQLAVDIASEAERLLPLMFKMPAAMKPLTTENPLDWLEAAQQHGATPELVASLEALRVARKRLLDSGADPFFVGFTLGQQVVALHVRRKGGGA